MRLLSAILVRNEADRFLREVLQNAKACADQVLVLDDNSEDDTVSVAQECGCLVMRREELYEKSDDVVSQVREVASQLRVRDQHSQDKRLGGMVYGVQAGIREGNEGPRIGETGQPIQPAWGNESMARKELWDVAVELAEPCKAWVLFQDADMLLSADPRPLTTTNALNTWQWPLYDMWSANEFRTDGYWRAHQFARPWMVNPFRVPEGWQAVWSERGIHCGHLPENWVQWGAIAPPQYYWKHLAYSTPESRERKHTQYLEQQHQLTESELAHARSILDPLT